MSSAPLKNVIILGANGSVGMPILTALLTEPRFVVTILTRGSSSATFPSSIPVIKVSDAYTTSELVEAFKGQDCVISSLSTGPVTNPKDDLAFRIIDAAVTAGVKRIIPSEFGTNNLDPRASSLVPVYEMKGKMLRYLQQRADESDGNLTWTSVACGSLLDWGLDPKKSQNFLGIDVKGQKATIYDSGRTRFAVTTSENTGLAVARALLNPAETANKQIFLSDFTTTPRDIVESLEKQTGKKWSIEQKDSAPEINAWRKRFDGGEFSATIPLLIMSFVSDVDVGYDFEKEQDIWNEKLGLPKQTLDEVVKEAIELANRS